MPLSLGWAGVPVFFVVSGFCIHLSFSRNPSWRNFGIRRFFRIYPPYFFAVLLFALVIPWSRSDDGFSGAAQIGNHLALLRNFDSRFYFGINPSFWSIAIEAQLYVLYPILLALVTRLGWRRSLGYIAVLELGLRLVLAIYFVIKGRMVSPPLGGLPLLYWYSWSICAAVAEAYVLGRPIPFSNHSVLAWSVIAIGSNFLKPFAPFSFLFFALLTATVIAKLLRYQHLTFRLPVFFSRSFSIIGVWSYSIYLLHQPLLGLAPQVVAKFSLPDYLQELGTFALCLCFWFPIVELSALWYRVVELPSIALSKRVIANISATTLND